MSKKNINVTKSYLPPLDEYIEKISTIWENHWLTNYGPLNNEFIDKVEKYLNLKNVHYVSNGTVSLQLAFEAMNITDGEIITTPFTFIATISSIVWQRCTPVFVDIDKKNFNIDVNKIEKKINENTKAILAVHCFGFPCDVDRIQEIANKYNIKVIYDAAHSFGTKIGDKSVLSYGDISSCSLHGTKVFHSIEGGLCVVNNNRFNEKMNAIKNFGNNNGNYDYVGINAKNSEFHAAMGICVLNHIEEIINNRKHVYELYVSKLKGVGIEIPKLPNDFTYNYIYFPVLFNKEEELLKTIEYLSSKNIFIRRYFYPCLNELKIFGAKCDTPIACDISRRIACLPMDTYLNDDDIDEICNSISKVLKK